MRTIFLKKRLAEVDGCIAQAAESGLFDMNFEAMVSELDYAEYHIEKGLFILFPAQRPLTAALLFTGR
ncbi:MAG: hypothetical protein L6V87_03715 [Ruminococcus sp.]|nr:MAG: hypothetical protein L6V87_03715 [Ruminococcus sp.]